jgi:DNA-binding NtrC family response regulator
MVAAWPQFEEVNVLASEADWSWPIAVRRLFEPRGVNMLMAHNANEFVDIMRQRRIHATIVDGGSERAMGLSTIRLIRMEYPTQPCILLADEMNEWLLEQALNLGVFSVVKKPVEIDQLRQLLDKLFVKRYNSDIFRCLE